MKRMIAMVLCAACLCGAFAVPAGAAAGDPAVVRRVAAVLGVDAGQTGAVTRGAFARLLAGVSAWKDAVPSAGNVSPYADVPHTDPAAGAIKLAAEKGWMSGYLDGLFRPGKAVTAAEASTALLSLLGYTAADLSGSYPEAQLALSASLGLRDGVSTQSTLTYGDCARMFYNLLSARAKENGQRYAQALGYALDSAGNPDYAALLQKATEGPVIVTAAGAAAAIPFVPQTVYRNDASVAAADLQPWDVLYYDRGSRTVWAYARRVTGTYEKATPGKQSPTAVTVAGVEYPISGAAAAALGTGGGLALGANVTLLLGRNGEAVAAVAAETMVSEVVGVITASGKKSYPAANGALYESPTITLTALDGQSYTVRTEKSYTPGSLVKVSFTADKATVTTLSGSAAVAGRVSFAAGKIGSTPIAADALILDADEAGGARVFLSRLDGMLLSSDRVRWAQKNAAGQITALVLRDVTGDRHQYGVVLSAREQSNDMNISGEYRFLIDGEQTDHATSGKAFGARTGPARFVRKNEELVSVRALEEVKDIETLSGVTLRAGGKTYTVWDRASAYLVQNGNYRRMDRSELDTGRYRIRAFIDREDAAGGRVRVLLASAR